jgi:hypothetical protein
MPAIKASRLNIVDGATNESHHDAYLSRTKFIRQRSRTATSLAAVMIGVACMILVRVSNIFIRLVKQQFTLKQDTSNLLRVASGCAVCSDEFMIQSSKNKADNRFCFRNRPWFSQFSWYVK